ncbi:LamG-like jellyroll fold domain-containing protein [Nonomuraea sp. CA-141351]|uniref:LamG-like jellyroll fold domain-containing protein n=1 Tax=Nonomuraea sp. CA-141351 TaxID=3239996 RepID=UPI003D8B0E7D
MNTRRLAPGWSTRTRRRGALIAALMLPLSLMSAPAIAQGPTPSPTPTSASTRPPGATSDPALKTAWDKAAKSGQPIEVPAQFTETMKVWANPDGKNLRAELHTRPIQLKNPASGAWEPIDTRIVTRDGKLQAARVKTPLTFGGRGAKHLVSAAEKRGEIGLGVTEALPEPKVSGNAVTYPDAVAPGADLVVLAQADGFVSQVVFRQRPTGPVTVRLPLTLPEGTIFGKTPQGLPQLKDAKGKAKAAPIVLTATDAKVEAAPEQGRTSSVKAQVETTGKTSELVFSPDEKFLADPAVTYPVTVAASSIWFGGGAPDDAWISKNDPYNNNAAAGYLRAGTTSTSADIARVYMKFDTTDPVLQGATVNDADLRMWNYKSGGPNGQLCGETMGAGIRAARVTSDWTLDGTIDSLDWYNQPSSTAAETVNKAGYNYDADPASWCAKDEELFYEVTAMTRAWIQQGVPNHGIVLKAASETAAINWRQYYSSQFGGGDPYPGYRHPPALIIDYTPAPSFFIASWTYSDEEEIDTYEEAVAALNDPARVRATSSLTTEAPITWEEAYAQKANSTESLTAAADEILNRPRPEEPPPPTPDPGVDTTPPQVVEVTPSEAAVDVPVDTQVTVTFSEPVTDAQFSVRDRLSEGQIPGSMAMSADNKVLTFTLAQPLTGTLYEAQVSGAKDAAGNVMAAPYVWRFKTTVQLPEPTPTPTPTPTPMPGLVAAYGMNEGTGFIVGDSSGQNNTGTGSSTTWANGKYGKALSFNGSSSWVTVQDAASLHLTTGMTLSAWVSPATVADWSSVVAKELSASGVSYTMYAANGGSVPSGWVQTSAEDHSTVGGVSPLPVNTWSHLALTYDGATLRLFVNGQQIAQTALSGSLYDDGSPLRIGGNNIWGEFYNGLIDELRIYNRAQTATEIQADMNTPVGSTTPGPDPTPTPTPTPTPDPDPDPDPVPGLVAAYSMEEGTGTSVGDASGQNNTGAATDTTWTTGKHGQALSFNGSSSWVTVPHSASLRLTNALTLSAWVRPATVDDWRTVLMKEHADGGTYGLYASTGDSPLGWLKNARGDMSVVGDNPLPLNQWSHLAVTYDGSMATLYVDGAPVDQTPMSGDLVDDGGALRLGGNSVWGEHFSGVIDEVRIYNRAQTVAQIQADMSTPIGAAASGAAARRLQKSSAPEVQKLVVDDSRTVDGVTVTSDLTPSLTAWLSGGRDGEAKVEVEIAHTPTKSVKAGKATSDKRLIWSGQATAASGESKVSLQVPKGQLRDGEKVRWRARMLTGQQTGPWADWRSMQVKDSSPAEPEHAQAQEFAASAALTPPPAVNEHPRMTPAQCEARRSEARRSIGWTMNRYSWCSIGKFNIKEVRGVGSMAVIKTHFASEMMIIGYTFNGTGSLGGEPSATSRDIFLDLHAKIISVTPSVAGYTLKMGAMPADDECDHVTEWNGATHHNNFAKPMGLWVTGDTYRFHLRCPAENARAKRSVVWDQDDEYIVTLDNDERVTLGRFKLYGDFPDLPPILPDGGRYVTSLGNKEASTFVQCDSAEYIRRGTGGCVFGDVTSSLEHVLGQGYDAAYKHYWTACYEPNDTYPILLKLAKYPAVKEKSIPGCLDPDKEMKYNYLHRVDPDTAENNRDSITRPECNWLWGASVGDASGNDCDEFPFASSWERWNSPYPGANLTRAGYSLCPVPATQNRAAGTLLGKFYNDERILVGDPYFIKFRTQLDGPEKCAAPIAGHN